MNTRSTLRGLIFTLGTVLVAASNPVLATTVEHDAYCHDVYCGKMVIDTYETVTLNQASTSEFWLQGAQISGTFQAAKQGQYHYIQALQNNSDSFRWAGNTAPPLPQPYIDPPMGGYMISPSAFAAHTTANPWDSEPWYDDPVFGNAFPTYFDQPRDYVLQAKSLPGGVLSWSFETWVVCLIDAVYGSDAGRSSDDNYVVATLLGWQWGFDVAYVDQGVIGTDELADFTVTLNPAGITWVLAPTALWTNALAAVYGSNVLGNNVSDNWNIQVRDCQYCAIPTPDALALFLPGVFGLFVMRRRWRN